MMCPHEQSILRIPVFIKYLYLSTDTLNFLSTLNSYLHITYGCVSMQDLFRFCFFVCCPFLCTDLEICKEIPFLLKITNLLPLPVPHRRLYFY